MPTVFSHRAVPESILQEKVQRHQRLLERKENIAKNESAQVLLSLSQEEPLCVTTGTSTQTPVQSVCEMAVQTEISLPVMTGLIVTNQYLKSVCDKTAETCAELKQEQELLQRKCEEHVKDIEMLKASLQRLEEENKFLRDDVEKKTLSFQNLKGDDRRTKFYTGFPNFETLSAVLSVTSTKVKRRRTKLPKEDELLLTLVKLRRNLAMTDLFQNEVFRKVKCVIDCTEIFIERPSNLKARAQTYSNYKRHNTIKILVGISPSGCVTFLSTCWGGRVSDRQITCDSGLLDKLVPGDVVLADRGFNMSEDFAIRGAKLIVPAFTKGKKQLSREEVEKSRMMSRARIHIERVIGRLKDFEIIKGTLPINLVKRKVDSGITSGDKLVRVVTAIINTNGPIL